MLTHKQSKQAVYAFAEQAYAPIDVFAERKKSGRIVETATGDLAMPHPGVAGAQIALDFETWLPFSSSHYHISSNPSDYILVPVVAMPSDLPNRNSAAFPLSELIKFDPELGMQAFKTWKGKPTFLEHRNDDITKAYGVIADSSLRKLNGWSDGKVWKLLLLLAFDRSKHSDVTDKISSGEFNSYSMGAWVSGYTCSYCGAEVGKCVHIDKHNKNFSMYELNGKIVSKNCHDICGFECSSVGTPAFISAISDRKMSI